jgi:hypothetical protein
MPGFVPSPSVFAEINEFGSLEFGTAVIATVW